MASSSSSTTTTSSSSENIALEECDIPCVPEFTKNSNTRIKKQCSKDLLTDKKCHIDDENYKYIYDTIDWNILYTNLDKYISFFVSELINDINLRKGLSKIYTYGPGVDKSSKFYADLRYIINQNDDAIQCQNILVKFYLYRGDKAKAGEKQKQNIAHISLHPKLSKFYRNSTRSRSGCGYSCRVCNSNTSTDLSPFHYIIDTVRWTDRDFKSNNPLRPEISLKIEERSGSGRFLEMTKSDEFPQLTNEDFPYTDKEIDDGFPQDLNELHKGIVNKFVDIWNRQMLDGFIDPDTKEVVPSIRKGGKSVTSGSGSGTAGGKRKTRKQKHRRHRTRKH